MRVGYWICLVIGLHLSLCGCSSSQVLDPYERMLRGVLENYDHRWKFLWTIENPQKIKLHLSDWVIHEVQEEGHMHPYLSLQVMVTLTWQDIHFQGWNTSTIREDKLVIEMYNEVLELLPELEVLMATNLKQFHKTRYPWGNLVLRRDGTLQLSSYLQMDLSYFARTSGKPYPLDEYKHLLLFNAHFPDPYHSTECERTDLAGRCDMGKVEVNSTDQKWKWSARLYNINHPEAAGIILFTKLRRNLAYFSDDQRVSYISGMTFDWRKEGSLPLLSGLCILAQYLLACFVREKFILGMVNLIVLSMALMHYDLQPALQLNDICPWITYYSLVFTLQVVALVWFSVRTFLCCNSSLLTMWLSPRGEESCISSVKNTAFKILMVISCIGLNERDHAMTLKKLMSLEKNECIRLDEEGGHRGSALNGVEQDAESRGSLPRDLEDNATRSDFSQEIEQKFSASNSSRAAFVLFLLSVDRVLFVVNSFVLLITHIQYA